MEHKVTSGSTQCEKNNVSEQSVTLMLEQTGMQRGMSRTQTHTEQYSRILSDSSGLTV